MASTKRKTRRRHARHHAAPHRRHTRRRRVRRNPSLGGLHMPSTNRIIGGVAAAVAGPMIGAMLFKNATGPMKSLGLVVGGLGVAIGAGMLLGRDAAEGAALVAIAVPAAGLVASSLPGIGTSAGYSMSDAALAQLGALPDGFAEPLSGFDDPARFAFPSDE